MTGYLDEFDGIRRQILDDAMLTSIHEAAALRVQPPGWLSGVQAMMDQIATPRGISALGDIQSACERIHQPVMRMIEDVQRAQTQLDHLRAVCAPVLPESLLFDTTGSQEIIGSLQLAIEQQRQLLADKFLAPSKALDGIRVSFQAIEAAQWARGLHPSIGELVEATRKLLEDCEFTDFDELSPEEQSEVTAVGEDMVQFLQGTASMSPEEFLDRLSDVMSRGAPSKAKAFIRNYLYPLLLVLLAHYLPSCSETQERVVVNVVNVYIDNSVTHVAQRPCDVVRLTRREVREIGVPEDSLRRLRVVKQRSVAVFEEPRTCSDRCGRLRAGAVVRVLGRSRHWRFVEFKEADSGELTTGWVRSRQLGKLHR